MSMELGAGAWSYFGDPRAIHHDGRTFTGWISTTGNVWVAIVDTRAASRGRSADLPRAWASTTTTTRRWSSVATGTSSSSSPRTRAVTCPSPGQPDALPDEPAPVLDRRVRSGSHRRHQRPRRPRLHVPEPDPAARQAVAVLARGRLEPDVLLHAQRPRRLGAGARARATSATSSGRTRSTVGDGRNRIHGIFTDGHPSAGRRACTTRATRTARSTPRAGAGSGRSRSIPLHTSKLDHDLPLQRSRRARLGRTTSRSIARAGRTSSTRAASTGTRDTFYYAYFNGTRWVSHKIVEAGPRVPSFTSGGATLDHEDPRVVYLSRRIGTWYQVEVWSRATAAGRGRTRQLTDAPERLLDPPGHAARGCAAPATRSCSSAATIARSATASTGAGFTRSSSELLAHATAARRGDRGAARRRTGVRAADARTRSPRSAPRTRPSTPRRNAAAPTPRHAGARRAQRARARAARRAPRTRSGAGRGRRSPADASPSTR